MNAAMRYRANRPQVIFEQFEDEIVLINLDSGNYYSLNRPAADVWGLMEKGCAAGEIAERMVRLYEGDSAQIEAGVHRLLTELHKEGIIVPSNGVQAAEQAPGPVPAEKKPFDLPVLHAYNDMQELLLLDPIHEVTEQGWPNVKTDEA